MRRVVAGESILVAAGWLDGRPALWTSTDGVEWSVVPDAPNIASIAAASFGFVGVGTEETIEDACQEGANGDCFAVVLTSPDGISWTRVAHDAAVFGGGLDKQMMWDVATVGDQVVAVGTSVWISPDGRTWARTYQDPALTGDGDQGMMHAVAVGDEVIVVVGDGSTSPVVWVGAPDRAGGDPGE
jgi:hypothetical protein